MRPSARCSFPWGTLPSARCSLLIAAWLRQPQRAQALFGFPLLDTNLALPQDQKIRSVGCHHMTSRWPRVVSVQLYAGLVKELQHRRVVLHAIDGPQFDRVALELDRAPHLAAGVGATNVMGAPLHAPRRKGSAKTREQVLGLGAQLEPTTPMCKGGGFHHILPRVSTVDTIEASLLLQAYPMRSPKAIL
jgi:hypothetical protein